MRYKNIKVCCYLFFFKLLFIFNTHDFFCYYHLFLKTYIIQSTIKMTMCTFNLFQSSTSLIVKFVN